MQATGAARGAQTEAAILGLGKKLLPKIVKAEFNVSSMLNGKFGKRLVQKHRAQGQRLKAELVAMEKTCVKRCFGKRAADI